MTLEEPEYAGVLERLAAMPPEFKERVAQIGHMHVAELDRMVREYKPGCQVAKLERQGRPAKRGRGGRRPDLGGLYVRSTWEANWIRLLRYLGHEVEYEPPEWRMEFRVPRGVREYRPDIRCRPGFFCRDAPEELHELKGWMDRKSKTALRRVSEFHGDRIIVLYDPRQRPQVLDRVPLVVVAEHRYREATAGAAQVVPGWESGREGGTG